MVEEKHVTQIKEVLVGLRSTIDLLLKYQNMDGLSIISVDEIADKLKCAEQTANLYLKILQHYHVIVQITPGVYKVVTADLVHQFPVGLADKLIDLPKQAISHQELAQRFQVSTKEVSEALILLQMIKDLFVDS